jgi:GntR family transcriptional regulator, transcriptional repressor for pyruvate dehydrogenase complex
VTDPSRHAARFRARNSLSDGLTAGILELIKDQNLVPGDRLPPVQSLAQMFGVAAPTLREALRRLQTSGIVTIRHGSGIYVSSQVDRRILANPYMRSEADTRTVRELLETRLLLEPTTAKLAALSAHGEAASPAALILAEAEQQLDDETMLTTTNLQFHTTVARLSGNTILAETIDALLATYTREQREILALYEDRKRDYEDHRRILAAITAGNADDAFQEMHNHLNGVIEIVATRLAGN